MAWELSGVHWWAATWSGVICSSRRENLCEDLNTWNVLGFSLNTTQGEVLAGLSETPLEAGGYGPQGYNWVVPGW